MSAPDQHPPPEDGVSPSKKVKISLEETSSANLEDSKENSAMNTNENGTESPVNGGLDEALYSRQLYVLGHEAMNRMARANVLICGIGGLGIEVAKNVILGGVKSVTLQDEQMTTWTDLSSQFYLSDEDIGKNRADVSLKKLKELNSYVKVNLSTEALNEKLLSQFNVVVITEPMSEANLKKLSQYCHDKGICFILANTRGLFSRIFCDFGEKFTVIDVNGEKAISGMIAAVTNDEYGLVMLPGEHRHGLDSGDMITFSEVQGMTELNGCAPINVDVIDPHKFHIGNTRGLSAYTKGGIFTQVKVSKTISFKSLNESILKPECLVTDFSKEDRISTIHIAFQALDRFVELKGRYPRAANSEDSDEFVKLAKDLVFALGEGNAVPLNEHLLKMFSWGSSGNICPMNGFIGGVVAQEVMKACSGKFHPIFQWMYYDSTECLPYSLADLESPEFTLDEANFQTSNNRYDGQVAVFGNEVQKAVENLRYFVVGAGAIGCELLKNFAMIGLGAGENGGIFVTDNDSIERSNLNRQFLFRSVDVGHSKSRCAAAAIREMNPTVKIEPYENRVGPETECVYDETFFENLSGVANALDNVEARRYMDQRCILYRKPLLESGTLGTKGNTQVVIPHLTESYTSSQDPPEVDIPICTLKSFPHSIEHTLQWARDKFEGEFKQNAELATEFLRDPPGFLERTKQGSGSLLKDILESVHNTLIEERAKSFDDCIAWARKQWEDSFVSPIKQLLCSFPDDDFWASPKRRPAPTEFDAKNALCAEFVYTAANLRAQMYGIQQLRNKENIAEMAAAVLVEPFVPRNDVRIPVTEAEAEIEKKEQSAGNEDDAPRIDFLLKQLQTLIPDIPNIHVNPIEFEKDDDTNFHIDFITATSNSRATNYGIANADRHTSKLIAGKIIPAIATTTSVVSGLVALELFKLAQNFGTEKKLDRFKNGFVNLALPLFTFSEPMKAAKNTYGQKEWTLWDRFEVTGEMTLKQYLDHFQSNFDLEITMITHNEAILYSFFMSKENRAERMNMSLCEVVRRVTRKPIENHVRSLVFQLCCNDAEGEDVEVPYVKYVIPETERPDPDKQMIE